MTFVFTFFIIIRRRAIIECALAIYVLFAVAGYCDVSSINLIKGFQSSGDNGLIGTSLITRTSFKSEVVN